MNKELVILEESLTNIGWPKHCVHAGPVIRSEEEYKGYSLKDRQAIGIIYSRKYGILLFL